MNRDPSIKLKILRVLKMYHSQNVDRPVSVREISNQYGGSFSHSDIEDHLNQLAKDSLISLERDRNLNYLAKINFNGLEELEKLESNVTNKKGKSQMRTELPSNSAHANNVDIITPKPHDFFICHATEDKEIVARPLAQGLDKLGLDVWYDEFSLRWGSKLMKTITKGIRESKFGIVILSPQFFEKKWAQLELDALVGLLNLDDGELLPLVYNLTHEQVKEKLPLLSGILYRSWDEGLEQLVSELNDIANGKREGFRKTNVVKTNFISKNDSNQLKIKESEKKISDEDKKDLINNVYRPCFNQLMNEYRDRDFITHILPNKWKDLEPFWQHKTEPEMKEIFEEYGKEIDTWNKIFIEWDNAFYRQRIKFGELIFPAFEEAGIINTSDMIQLDETQSMDTHDWFTAFRFILLDPTITDASILHQKLVDFAKKTNPGHEPWLEQFNAKTDLFRYMVKLLPEIRNQFDTKITDEQLHSHRQKLKEIIEKLKDALEEKLK